MNYYSVFYWLTVADGVKSVFNSVSNWFTFFTVVSFVCYAIIIGISVDVKMNQGKENDDKDYKDALLWRKLIGRFYMFCQIVCIISWLGYALTPTKKDCLLIVAGGAVGNFITTDSSTKQLPSDVAKFLHLSLNKEIDDLSSTTKSDIKKELGIQSPKDKLLDDLKNLSKDQILDYLKKDTTKIK